MARPRAHTTAPLAALCATAALLTLAGCGGASKSTPGNASTGDPAGRAQSAPVVGPAVTVASANSGGARTVAVYARRGTGAGELAEPFGIGVDDRTGNFYVVDTNNERVAEWTGTGHFLRAWGWGVADGHTEALQTCTSRCYAGFSGDGPGQLHFAEGVAVDNVPYSSSRGDLYVVNIEAGRVEKFSSDGRFLLMFGGGVNRTARARGDRADEDVCPVERGDVCGKGSEGTSAGQLEFPVEGAFVAVGPHGDVYVGQRNSVEVFSPAGRYLSKIALSPPVRETGREPGGVSSLAVDSSGDLYVVRNGVVGIDVYAASGRLLRTIEAGGGPAYPEGPAPQLALDTAGNLFVDVYADERHRIDYYSRSGARIASFDPAPKGPRGTVDRIDGLPGMAYDPRTKLLYVVNVDADVTPLISNVRVIRPPRP